MPVLSNNGRLISSLPVTTIVNGQDEFLLQSSGITKRINYAALSASILSSTNFNPFTATVNFISENNKFTGSFYNPDFKSSNFYTVTVRDSLSVSNGIAGNLTGNVTGTVTGTLIGNVTGNVTGNITSTGTSTFSSIDVNGGTIDGTTVGASSATTVRGTTITATSAFVGNLTGNVTGNVNGNITSTGTSTFSSIDVNGGTIDGATVGASSATTVRGTTITATVGFAGNVTGNVTGDLTGDVYNSTSTKVLESGNTTPTVNGGVASAAFYGTSSYANQALTAAYASSGGSAINGIPSGGNQYQILAKNSGTNYDVSWTNPITSSNPGNPYNLVAWDGQRSITDYNNFYYNGIDTYVCTAKLQLSKLSAQSLTGSFNGVGFKTLNGKSVSFWGTGSHAVSASYALSLTPIVNTSTGTVSDFVGGTNEGGVGTYCYAVSHGFGASPSSIRATLYCASSDAGVGYVAGDEVDLNVVESNQLDANIFSTWTNSTYAAVSVAGNTGFPNDLYIPAKTGGTWPAIDKSKWKIKIRVWK